MPSHTHCSPGSKFACGCGAGWATGQTLWGGAGWSHQTPFRCHWHCQWQCLQQSFGSQVTFVRNCPSRVPGSSARLVRGRPCKQLPKPAEGGGGGEVNCLENHQRSKHDWNIVATRSNPSAYQIPAASTEYFFPQPPQISFPRPPPNGGRGERSASPSPGRRVRLTTPTPFPLPSAHTTMCRNTLRPILCCTGALWSTGARGGGGTHSHVAPPTRFSHTLSLPPPFPPSFTPTLPPSHIEA